jgi:hypothetical protein
MNLIAAWPRFMRPEIAEEYLGGRTMLQKMIEQKLIKPRVQGNKLTLYDKLELDAACDAFKSMDA